MKRFTIPRIFVLILLISLSSPIISQQLSFPGAEGFGRHSMGGRGGSVYFVTNLNDAGTGSLRNGLKNGNVTIVFSVSGTIYLKSALVISNDYTTIAGQSAPGDGICLANYTFRVEASHVIVRYIRSRLGDVTKYADDAMDANGNSPIVSQHDIIIDHCSMSWCLDEAGSFYDNKNFTLQWCILSESLYHSFHPKGDHGYGGIWGGQGATFHHNLLAHHTSRNPRFCGSRYTGDSINEIVDMRNNVIYNWGNINTAYGGESGNYNMVNNYYKYGPATPNSKIRYRILNYSSYYAASDAAIYPDTVWGGKFFVDGNYVYGFPATTADNWNGGGSKPGVQPDGYAGVTALMARNKLTAPIAFAPVNTQTAEAAFIDVVAKAGALMPRRDTIDRRIANETLTGTVTFGGHYYDSAYTKNLPSGIIDSQKDVGGWPTLNSTTAPVDADKDGMADEWETQRGLNPASANDRNLFNKNGYTNLENYLNGDSIIAVGTPNTCIASNAVLSANTGLWLDLKDTGYTRLISVDTNNVIVSVLDSAIALGNIRASYYTTNNTRFIGLTKPYLNRNITITADSVANNKKFKLRLYITKAELNSLINSDVTIKSINDLKVIYTNDATCQTACKSSPTLFLPLTNGVWGTYATGYYIDILTSNLGTYFFASAGFVEPLRLLSFKALNKEGKANLQWTTSNEINVERFEVEKSTDGNSFYIITTVATANLTDNHTYFALDANLNPGTTYYRLKMIDKSGEFTYSNVVSITGQRSGLEVHPNPAKAVINIIHGKLNSNTPIKIFSAQGQLVLETLADMNSDNTTISVNNLSKGVYFISMGNDPAKVMILKD